MSADDNVAGNPYLETARLILTVPTPLMAARRLVYAIQNREHLAPWEPLRTDSYFTEAYWEQELATTFDEYSMGRSLRFILLDRLQLEGPILGVCNFNNIIRGAFQACHLGYSIDGNYEGKGLMQEALSTAIPFVFDVVRLHRIMANYLPTNVRSGNLLRKLGFVVEGTARDYLYIAGQWQDHILTSLTNPYWRS